MFALMVMEVISGFQSGRMDVGLQFTTAAAAAAAATLNRAQLTGFQMGSGLYKSATISTCLAHSCFYAHVLLLLPYMLPRFPGKVDYGKSL